MATTRMTETLQSDVEIGRNSDDSSNNGGRGGEPDVAKSNK